MYGANACQSVAATAAAFLAVVMVITVTATATITLLVVMIVLAMNMAVCQFFRSRFADGHHFHVEVQVLTSQHVIAINHHMVAINFSDLNWHLTLIGISQETHTNL